jgi:AcrR family transcriptional regulator
VSIIPPPGEAIPAADQLPESWREPPADTPAGRLFQAARLRFAADGFHAASTRAIAEAAGLNQALVHYYFGSKAALYRRVLTVELLKVLRHQTEGRLGVLPLEELLATFPGRLHAWFQDHPETARLLRREIGAEGGVLREILPELGPHGPLGLRKRLSAAVKTAVTDGRLRPVPADHLLVLLLSISYGLVLMEPLFQAVLGTNLRKEATRRGLQASIESVLRGGLAPEVKP